MLTLLLAQVLVDVQVGLLCEGIKPRSENLDWFHVEVCIRVVDGVDMCLLMRLVCVLYNILSYESRKEFLYFV